jgi:hypothetical protein
VKGDLDACERVEPASWTSGAWTSGNGGVDDEIATGVLLVAMVAIGIAARRRASAS